jgi:hypothetical protein
VATGLKHMYFFVLNFKCNAATGVNLCTV